MDAKGYAHIRIENCGNAMWGAVIWEQKPGIDNKNPDQSKRGRPTLGMPILLDMKPVEQNKWAGQIYNSEDGQTYSSNISLGNPDLLQVRGCVLGILCGGEDWTRVKDELVPGAAVPGTPGAAAPAPKPGAPAPAASQPRSGTPAGAMAQQKPGALPPPPISPPKPGVVAPPKPFDIATATVDEFCAVVPLNGAAPAH
jgi:hypothetical protein